VDKEGQQAKQAKSRSHPTAEFIEANLYPKRHFTGGRRGIQLDI